MINAPLVSTRAASRVAARLILGASLFGMASPGNANPQHVLILSIDGMHAFDLARYARLNPSSAMATLLGHGYNYTQTSTARPADSFPGGLAIFTGGSPASTGVYFDTTYDRTLWPAGVTSGPTGAVILWDDSLDINNLAIDGGGGLDPAKLPRDPARGGALVYPHNYLRVNTIFEAVKAAGMRTAWCDKHLADEIVNGPSGTGVDDLYTPEIASTNSFGGSITKSVAATEAYDDLKVTAVLNQINGMNHTGTTTTGVPAIFGMNFQAVSVAQRNGKNKTISGTNYPSGSNQIVGGYTDATGTPSPILADALSHTDAQIQNILSALTSHSLLADTYVVLTAKHGNSPVDKTKLTYAPVSGPGSVPGIIDPSVVHVVQATQDDCSLLWLADQSQTALAVSTLLANQVANNIVEVWAGDELKTHFPDPLVDPRAPDIIVIPKLGMFYDAGLTESPVNPTNKIAEHGGFNDDDVHVPLVVYNPGLVAQSIKSPVQTAQIAPTAMQILGLSPFALQAVVQERTAVLPGFEAASLAITPGIALNYSGQILLTGGQAQLQVSGVQKEIFTLQASTDLVNWAGIGTSTATLSTVTNLTDPNAGSFPRRFYRAVPTP
jgi:hypothetical protein